MKKSIIFHILGLNLKMSYQIASLFHMYIDMGERIGGKQDRFSLIIEDPLRAPFKFFFFIFFILTQKVLIRLLLYLTCKLLLNGGYM